MRQLILMRHGKAQAYQTNDASRTLIEQGRSEVAQTAMWLRSMLLVPDQVFSSPYIRAMQTAEIVVNQLVASQLTASKLIQEEMLLIPDADPAMTTIWLNSLYQTAENGVVLCTTHMPLVADLTMALCASVVRFETATAAVLHEVDQQWRLHAYFQPSGQSFRAPL